MLKIKFKNSTKSKRPIALFNHQVYFGFKIGKLPNRFAEITSEQPIRAWFNCAGYTYIEQEEFKNLFGKITIE